MGLDVRDFKKEVLDRSYETPVLVDFWAEWCGPCRILGPILERLAQEANGQWQLAKVNTEEHPEVAMEYGIRSIPNVKLFVDGKVAGEFVGALPEAMVRQWLKKFVPGRYQKQLAQAEQLLVRGENDRAQKILENILNSDPQNVEGRILLARTILFREPQQAARLVENIDEPRHSEMIEAIRTVARLASLHLEPDALPASDVRETYREAIRALLARDFERALQSFITVIRTDRYYDDDGSRKACIAIFKLLGEEHEITKEYRREFSSALYV